MQNAYRAYEQLISKVKIMSTDKVYRLFTNSYIRCTSNPEFVDEFYRTFISSSNEIEKKFKFTNFSKQRKLLLSSLSYMILAYTARDLYHLLGHISRSHCRSLHNIEPHLYLNWLDSLVETVGVIDPHYTADIGEAWRIVMQPGIDYIISGYDNEAC